MGTHEGTVWYRIQRRIYKWLTFTVPVFYGRNVFSYNMGPFPYRRPLTVVVGDPIRVDQRDNPTQEELENLRSKYIKALRKLYEEWQPRLEPGRESPLVVV
uniref:diacylglycerol O-acyltransferase n=1 Tax=Alexandrium andersonii TaxID=327968 RepID=A0A7S2BGC0_9DINO|mmetsp:Transcript_25555/g.58053  ORF Transcript_25555/g.58053 Transcript_25555/m.58053 type:complete len:101 (+) Transcript_25555:155-457(+)